MEKLTIDPAKVVFEETCNCCPEAYKLLYEGEEIGYMKLRGGYLALTAGKYVSVFSLTESNIDVWDYYFDGDPWKGMFDDENERRNFQNLCIEKLVEYFDGL